MKRSFSTASVTLAAFLLFMLMIAGTGLSQSEEPICGDTDGDQSVIISDAVFLINYIFSGGPAPAPLSVGDCDLNGTIDIGDAVWLINYIFAGGPAPCMLPIELSTYCLDGRPYVVVTNNLVEMGDPAAYSVLFESGESVAGTFQLQSDESDTVGISNLYGSSVFRLDGSGQQIAVDYCLSNFVDSLIREGDINETITNPVFEDFEVSLGIVTCKYDFYLDSLAFDTAYAEIIPTAGGLILQTTYINLIANFELDATPIIICPGGYGSFTIDTLLVGSELTYNIINSDSVDVEFDTTTTYVNFETDVAMEGALAALIGSEFTVLVEDTTSPFGAGMVALFRATVESLLEAVLVP